MIQPILTQGFLRVLLVATQNSPVRHPARQGVGAVPPERDSKPVYDWGKLTYVFLCVCVGHVDMYVYIHMYRYIYISLKHMRKCTCIII